ncbi:MAG: Flagellar motor rotation protein MotB [Deltaproteobacteria bacterium]|nr:Flagellar motor rotation protein MotB [Deltaproteobacteria bacterium]
MGSSRSRAVVALVVLVGHQADADNWLVAEAPAAMAVSDAQQGVFRPGVMPAIGFYAASDRVALGIRLRAGVLRDGPAPGGNRQDPGTAGLTTGGLAFRFLLAGGWAELAGGGGITGRDLVPTVELGVGWSFDVGRFDVGPSARYVRVISRDQMQGLGTAELALIGVEVRFGKQRAVPRLHLELPPPIPTPPPVHVAEPMPAESDLDTIVDREPGCAEDLDGCRISDEIMVVNDRIILDDRVLFDLNRARVRSAGRQVVTTIAQLWKSHPEWLRLTIEGHTDATGTDQFNLELSQRRADQVRALMIKRGSPADAITAVGLGRTRLRDTGTSELANQHNRRVEFVIERGKP